MILGGVMEIPIKMGVVYLDMVGVGGSNPLGRTNPSQFPFILVSFLFNIISID